MRSEAAKALWMALSWSDRLRTGSKNIRTYCTNAISVPMVTAERMASVPPYHSTSPSAAAASTSTTGQNMAK